MRSLIYKDFANLKVQGKLYVLIMGIWAVTAWVEKNPSFLGGILAVFSVLITITTCAYDERSGWDKYALTMPVGKRELVLSKYVISLLTLAVGMLVFVGLNLLLQIEPSEFLLLTGIFTALGLIVMDVVLPIIFRFGTEKGRILLILVFLVPTVLGLLMEKSSLNLQVSLSADGMCMLALGLGVILFPVSAYFSLVLYGRRELRSQKKDV